MTVVANIRSDCLWCHSTGSVEFGICQVCLSPSASVPHPDTTELRLVTLTDTTLELSTGEH